MASRGVWATIREGPADPARAIEQALRGGAAAIPDTLLGVLESERIPHADANLPADLTPERATSARHAGAGLDAALAAQCAALVRVADREGWRVLTAALRIHDDDPDPWRSIDAALERALDVAGANPFALLAFPQEEGGLLLACGPGISHRGPAPDDAKWEDLAPTALALLGLPVPAAMTGLVIEELARPREAARSEARSTSDRLERRGPA